MSLEGNKSVVRRVYEEGWNQRQYRDLTDELYSTDFMNRSDGRDREGLKQFHEMLFSALPDLHITLEEIIAEGELVVVRWTCTGTHEGEFTNVPGTGVPGTGKPVQVSGMSISRIVDGKIVEEWGNWDQLGFMIQVGAIPAPD